MLSKLSRYRNNLGRMPEVTVKERMATVLLLGLGSILLISGASKIVIPGPAQTFLKRISGGSIDGNTGLLAAAIVGVFEAALAGMLFLKGRKFGLQFLNSFIALLTLFTVLLIYALFLDLNVECGCSPILLPSLSSGEAILRNLILIGIAAVVMNIDESLCERKPP